MILKRFTFNAFEYNAFYIASWLLVNYIEFRVYPIQISGMDGFQFEVFSGRQCAIDHIEDYIHGKVMVDNE